MMANDNVGEFAVNEFYFGFSDEYRI